MQSMFITAINHETTDREVRVAKVAVDFNRGIKWRDSRYWLAHGSFASMWQVTALLLRNEGE